MSFIDFDELVPGCTVTIRQPYYLDAVELNMAIGCKDRDVAFKDLRRLDSKNYDTTKLVESKIPGKGNHKTLIVHFRDAAQLVMVLPGTRAKQIRQKFADVITRFYAGDHTLVQEIQDNSVSSNPISQMARAALADGSESPSSMSIKRKREELEIQKYEIDIQKTRVEAQCAINAAQLATMHAYDSLCSNITMDERAKVIFKDVFLNSAILGRAITNGQSASEDATPTSVSQVAKKMGMVLTNEQAIKVGKIVAKLYRAKYDEPPSKHTQLVNGRATEVNTYFKKDEDLLTQALTTFQAEQLAHVPVGPG
jgi:hypothetical protein